MSENERKNIVKKFVAQWSGRGYEKGESHSFWLNGINLSDAVIKAHGSDISAISLKEPLTS